MLEVCRTLVCRNSVWFNRMNAAVFSLCNAYFAMLLSTVIRIFRMTGTVP